MLFWATTFMSISCLSRKLNSQVKNQLDNTKRIHFSWESSLSWLEIACTVYWSPDSSVIYTHTRYHKAFNSEHLSNHDIFTSQGSIQNDSHTLSIVFFLIDIYISRHFHYWLTVSLNNLQCDCLIDLFLKLSFSINL